jgi:hypothetical protein
LFIFEIASESVLSDWFSNLVKNSGSWNVFISYFQARLKRHRWHRKVLKTKDPVIFSIGWRRYQTTPVYAIEDRNGRHRMLKYTPEHMHCLATFWGPLAPPNTGVVAVQNLTNNQVIILDFLHKFSDQERNLILVNRTAFVL